MVYQAIENEKRGDIMKFGGKEFSDYWKIIKIPTLILIAFGVLGFIISIISFSLYTSIFSAASGWILTIAIFGFIGWSAVKDHKENIKIAAWAGALSGAISGFVGAIISILMFYLTPEVIEAVLQQAAQAGTDAAAIQGFMAIGIFIGLITGPLFSGIIAAIISTIAALIAKKI